MNIIIDVKNKKYETVKGNFFPLSWGIYIHHRYETWKYPPYHEKNILTFGRGVLPLIGGNRLIFTFRSPLWDGFHFSAMGGAGYTLKFTGLRNVAIVGRCDKPSLLVIEGDGEGVKIDFIDMESYLEGYTNIYHLNDYILEKFNEKNYRALIVGPAGINTNMGAIFSQTVKNGKLLEGSEDWAGRGGVGSVLFRAHNILGIVYYGDKDSINEELKKEKKLAKKLRKMVEEYYNKPYMKVILEHTKKYRYNEETGTGGTFGNNYLYLLDTTPIFNWRMPYIPKHIRMEFHKKILKYLVEKFNREAIETRNWTTCGEPCPVQCKKYRKGLKVDYEPYEASGPLLGIFDIYTVDKVVHTIDSLGFDAIECGNLIAWVFELLHVGLLKPEEVGIDKPVFDISQYKSEEDILKNSQYNGKLAVKLAEIVAFGKNEMGRILGLGIRKASKILNERFKGRLENRNVFKRFNDYGVYVPFGDEGGISPTMYWAIGNFIPYLIQGRYLTYYKAGVFPEPEELARLSVERIIEEITLDNIGLCRFHRGWCAPLLDILVKETTGEDIKSITYKLIKDIWIYDKLLGGYPPYIESQRVKDLIVGGAEEFGNETWASYFEVEGEGKLKEYIKRVLDEYSRLLGIDWKMNTK